MNAEVERSAAARGRRLGHVDYTCLHLFIDPAAAPLPFPGNCYHLVELMLRAGRPYVSVMDC